MECVICGQELHNVSHHRCSDEAEAYYRRCMSAKQSADTRKGKDRYGCGKTYGGRLSVGFAIMNGWV